jgi:hypothetical protein
MTDETTTTTTTDTETEPTIDTNGVVESGQDTNAAADGLPPSNGLIPMEERPEGLADPYWDEKTSSVRMGSMLKRLTDQQVKITELTTPRAPEAFAFNPPEHLAEHVSADDPLAGRVFDWAKKYDLPQVAVDDLLATYYADLPTVAGLTEGLAGEYGDHAGAVIEANAKWLNTIPDPAIRDAVDTLVLTADGHRALKYLRETMNGGRAIDDRDGAGVEKGLTYEDVLALKRKPEYWRDHDPAIVKQVKDGLDVLFPGDNAAASSTGTP